MLSHSPMDTWCPKCRLHHCLQDCRPKEDQMTKTSKKTGISKHTTQLATSWARKKPFACLNAPLSSFLFSLLHPLPLKPCMCNRFCPQMKKGSLPEGGALPLPDRHVVHSFGKGGISATHRHSCGYKEQQPERHDHEALPGQEQVPTDPHSRQPQLPRTPAAVRSLSPALSERPEVLRGESTQRANQELGAGEGKAESRLSGA